MSKYRDSLLKIMCELHPVTPGCGPCASHIMPLSARVYRDAPFPFEIDAVFTWVDGSDPQHRRKRESFGKAKVAAHKNGLESARFRNNDELRFSLRALERYAPWVRSIFLVTDQQRPDWLDEEHPKIQIVDHSEIIPEQFLPTFNSHVIEAHIHNIPGLAERFIYFNDDVFLAKPCLPHEFFTIGGIPMAFVDWRLRRLFGYHWTKTPHALSYFNTLAELKRKGVETDQFFITAHGPYAQTRANCRAAYEFYEARLQVFCHNKFRTNEEIAMFSHGIPLLMYNQKRIVPCDERYYYVQTKRRDRIAYYRAIQNSKKDFYSPLFFCINDVGGAGNQYWGDDLFDFLNTYFNKKSSFER